MARIETRIADQIIGHAQTLQSLNALALEGCLSATYLFVGPSGVGKKLVAQALAQTLVCESKDKPCGVCGSCIRIYKNSSESLKIISPDGVQIKLDQAQEVREFCQLAHHSARVIIIDQAEKLNPQAANMLLKTLEEPPPRTHFILLVPSLQSVLSTIRSRSQVIRFGLLPKEELQSRTNLAPWLIESSGGRMDQLEALQSEQSMEIRRRAQDWLNLTLRGQIDSVSDLLKSQSFKREESLYIIKFWREFLRDLWFQKEGLDSVMHSDLQWDADIANSLGPNDLILWSERVEALEHEVRGSANVSLSFETFMRGLSHVD